MPYEAEMEEMIEEKIYAGKNRGNKDKQADKEDNFSGKILKSRAL